MVNLSVSVAWIKSGPRTVDCVNKMYPFADTQFPKTYKTFTVWYFPIIPQLPYLTVSHTALTLLLKISWPEGSPQTEICRTPHASAWSGRVQSDYTSPHYKATWLNTYTHWISTKMLRSAYPLMLNYNDQCTFRSIMRIILLLKQILCSYSVGIDVVLCSLKIILKLLYPRENKLKLFDRYWYIGECYTFSIF